LTPLTTTAPLKSHSKARGHACAAVVTHNFACIAAVAHNNILRALLDINICSDVNSPTSSAGQTYLYVSTPRALLNATAATCRYMVYSYGPMSIEKLTDDYLDSAGVNATFAPGGPVDNRPSEVPEDFCEAPSLWTRGNGTYVYFSSFFSTSCLHPLALWLVWSAAFRGLRRVWSHTASPFSFPAAARRAARIVYRLD
jgi:hypothetical protein